MPVNYYRQIQLDEIWEENFKILLKYYELYGTLNVPKRPYVLDCPEWEQKLARWVNTQRTNQMRGKLFEWRYNRLVSVNFDFDPHETIFENHFSNLLKFKEKYGHLLVPEVCKDFPTLGKWVLHIRSRHVSDEHKRRLNEIGFVWDALDERWQNRFRELVEYKMTYGHFIVSRRKKELKTLGNWVKRLRDDKREGTLPKSQIQLLDSIDFIWEPLKSKWEIYYEKLTDFVNKNHHCLVLLHDGNTGVLGWWVYWLRNNKHKLSEAKIKQLDALGFEWDSYTAVRKRNKINKAKKIAEGTYKKRTLGHKRKKELDEIWEENFNTLLNYNKLHGTLNIPINVKNDKRPEWEQKLSEWVHVQRSTYKRGLLEEWRYNKLFSINFVFDQINNIFEQHFSDLLKFKEKHGHLLVPQKCIEYPKLGSWVAHLRDTLLTEERRNRLTEAGFVWNQIEEMWQIRFRELVEFKEKYGHFKVSRDKEYKELEQWTTRNRRMKRLGKLSNEKIQLLNTIDFNWEPVDDDWNRNYKNLIEFINVNHHCLVSIKDCKIDGLGSWVYSLRKNKNRLSEEKIKKLNVLGFEWDSNIAEKKRNEIMKNIAKNTVI